MKALGLILAAGVCLSCATDYVARTSQVRFAYEGKRYPQALQELKAVEAEKREVDKLLILLDRGMILHNQGKFEDSIKVLAEAERLSAQLDFVSISQEAATLITNERERAYKGEDFEKLMINVIQALNYAKLGDDEGALVEVRRLNVGLQKMISEEKKPYEQLAIARYLGGVLYEDQGNEDSAFIDYQMALKLQPELDYLAEPLLRLAKKTGRDDAYELLKRRFSAISHAPLKADEGQLLVVVEAGKAPEKISERRSSPQVIIVPRFQNRGRPLKARVAVEGNGAKFAVTVTDLRSVAQKHLSDRIDRILAHQLAGTAVKAGLAAGVGALTRDQRMGLLAFYLLEMTNEADLRSWMSLPAEFQIARFRLPAGKHKVHLESRGHTSTQEVTISPGRVSIMVERFY